METKDAESSFLTLLDLISEVWDATYSATRNLRVLIAMISSYMAKRGKAEYGTRRMCEGQEIKRILMELYRLWVTKGVLTEVCPKQEMHTFIRCVCPKELHDQIVKGIMTEETFREWVSEHHGYVGISELDSAITTATDEIEIDEVEVIEEEECNDGFDSLFESVAEHGTEPISQNVTRVQDGKLFVVKTPGETDSQLVRMYVYNVGDIKNTQKRDWWKRAKVRAQFLCSSVKTDPKYRALRQLFDAVASDLRNVPGVMRETRNIFQSQDTCSERKRKCNDSIATTSEKKHATFSKYVTKK